MLAGCPVLALGAIPAFQRASSLLQTPQLPPLPAVMRHSGSLPNVWMVEKAGDFEVYSNGLRIEAKGATFHSARHYHRFEKEKPETWYRALDVEPETKPAGIVFHTTESDLAPFDASQNSLLKTLARSILSYVRRHKSYHYLIDRFGRVNRVVEENSLANHAGTSIWADSRWAYVNLNASFLAVAFEAQTRPQGGVEPINEAQIHAGRILTDMLRSKYKIEAENCTTHSQVSVNPENQRIGLHTDFAMRFPYAEFGLPDNYAIPIPSMTVFGFTYDSSFVEISESRLWRGLLLSQEEVRLAALARRMTLAQYRAYLNRRYREIIGMYPKQS